MPNLKFKMPHVFTLLAGVVLVCSVLTWVLPSGQFQRETREVGGLTRSVVLPGTFETLEKNISLEGFLLGSENSEGAANPTSVVEFLASIPKGLEASADIIFFIFLIGGVFGILQRTGTIVAVVHALLQRFRNSGPVLTIVLMFAAGIAGSTLGMGEELIPLVPIFLIVAQELGYDRIYGLALVMLGADVGFAAATTNPFTVNIAQGIAEIPLNSALGFRMAFFVCAMSLAIFWVLRYGAKLRRDPSSSLVADLPYDVEAGQHDIQFERRHAAILGTAIAIFAFMLWAVQNLGWWLPEMAGAFLLMGVVAIPIGRLSVEEGVQAMVKGMEEMVVAALVVGFARAIQVVLEDASVLDTVIHGSASLLETLPAYVAAFGMLVFQTFLNFFIPSGSGQAAVTMPLMAPLADLIGLTRQTAVFAFTCGDGFSNTIIPTSGVLMAMLSLARIPWERWIRFMMPLFIMLIALSGIFLSIAVAINLQ